MSSPKPEGVIELVAEFTALPGREEEVERLLLALTAEVRNEPGCLEFTPHRVAPAPAGSAIATSPAPVGFRFVVAEAYRDEEAFAAHLAEPHGAEFNAALRPLIVEDRSAPRERSTRR